MKTKIICAWCGEKISEIKNDMGKDSHGICVKCYEKAMDELRDIEKSKPIFEWKREKHQLKA